MTTSHADVPSSNEDRPRALVIGTGLIGGSIGYTLRSLGWFVTGSDHELDRARRALELGAIDAVGDDPAAQIAFVAVPSPHVASAAIEALQGHPDPSFLVTDVAGVKARICAEIDDPRFIGGHPMAGSEQSGIEGARGDLFVGATWVLTPGASTPPEAYGRLLALLRTFGAQVVALTPSDHDRLVARVSHVPHLVAASLMNEAASAAEDDAALLQLAAGGFRDMTRVAAGDPDIWPDLCVENREAILEGIIGLERRLDALRTLIEHEDTAGLHDTLRAASGARRALPGRTRDPELLAQVRVPVPDQPGVLAAITAAASDLSVSVVDMEIAHSVEGDRGVMILVVDRADAERFAHELVERGFACSIQEL